MGDVEVDVWTGGEIDETAALRLLQFIRSGGLHLAQTNGRQKHSNHRKWRNAGRWRQLSSATSGYPTEKPIPFIYRESLVKRNCGEKSNDRNEKIFLLSGCGRIGMQDLDARGSYFFPTQHSGSEKTSGYSSILLYYKERTSLIRSAATSSSICARSLRG